MQARLAAPGGARAIWGAAHTTLGREDAAPARAGRPYYPPEAPIPEPLTAASLQK